MTLLLCSVAVVVVGYTELSGPLFFTSVAATALGGIAALAVAARSRAERARKRVFVLYSHHDRDRALTVGEMLEQSGYESWILHRDILPGQSLRDEVAAAFNRSRSIVVIISGHTAGDEFVQAALSYLAGLHRSGTKDEVFIVPLSVGGAPVPEGLADIQGVSFEERSWSTKLISGLDHLTGRRTFDLFKK